MHKHIDTIIMKLAEKLIGHEELKQEIFNNISVSPLLEIENLNDHNRQLLKNSIKIQADNFLNGKKPENKTKLIPIMERKHRKNMCSMQYQVFSRRELVSKIVKSNSNLRTSNQTTNLDSFIEKC